MSLHWFDFNPIAHLVFKTLVFIFNVLVMYRMAEIFVDFRIKRHIDEMEHPLMRYDHETDECHLVE